MCSCHLLILVSTKTPFLTKQKLKIQRQSKVRQIPILPYFSGNKPENLNLVSDHLCACGKRGRVRQTTFVQCEVSSFPADPNRTLTQIKSAAGRHN